MRKFLEILTEVVRLVTFQPGAGCDGLTPRNAGTRNTGAGRLSYRH